MDVWGSGAEEEVAATGGGNDVALAAARVGVGRHDESGWGKEEDVCSPPGVAHGPVNAHPRAERPRRA